MTADSDPWTTPLGQGWISRNHTVLHESPWITVERHEATAPTGRPADYGVVRFHNLAIAVLPLFDDGTTVLVGQHRFARMNYSWEIPEGGGAKDEPPLEAAKRELREEAGLVAGRWRLLLDGLELSNSVTDEIAFGFLALELSPAPTDPDETEALTLRRIPFAEALRLALAGTLKDVLTVAMLLRVYHMAREGGLPAELSAKLLGR